MPSHAKKVQLYKDETIPMFHRYQVETQIDAMHSQTVQLRSGGYIVINPTEALVAIDVNSGRSTRERNIEETAYKTNLEAAEEVARQLRLRDLAGLIVIDFIDMEDDRHNAAVERRLKEAMRTDRARIQLGRISPFGLMELSRQRLRPSLVETNFETCRHCGGAGVTRTIGSASLHVLRAIEEEGIRKRAREVAVHVPNTIALNILNQKRDSLAEIEARYGFRVYVEADDTLIAPDYRLERLRARTDDEESAAVDTTRIMAETDAALAAEAREEDRRDTVEDERAAEGDVEGRSKRRRKPRRRRKGDGAEGETAEARGFRPDLEEPDETGDETGTDAGDDGTGEDAEERGGDGVAATLGEDDADRPRKKRRRGKRGGRRRAVRGEGEGDELTARDSGETEGDDEEGDGREEDVREADARDTAWPEPGEAEAAGDTAARKPEAVTDAVEATEPAAEAEPSPAEPAPTPEAAAEPEAAEAQAAPAKPKRRRSPAKAATKTEGAAKPKRSRKKAVEAEPAEPAAAEAEPVPEAASDAADADSAAAEEKPKRKRAPRSRKKAEPTDAAETAGETAGETVAGKTADTAAAAETGEAPEKPKRKRPTRSRKKAEPAEAPTDTGATGAEPEAEAPAESPAPAAAETPANDAGAAADETDEGAGDHTNVIDVPEKPVDSTTADSKPRRGWWRRVIDR
jgi:ribonuclease E